MSSEIITSNDLKAILDEVLFVPTSVKFLGTIASNNYKQSAANTWQYVDLSFTVPVGHKYIVQLYTGWSSGKPIGAGLHGGSSLGTEGYPSFQYENSNGQMWTPCWALSAGTYYMFAKRGSAPTTTNYHAIAAWDFREGTIPVEKAQTDYIVEQGTSGIWTYRKWASGVAECWGETAPTSKAFTSQIGSSYYASKVSVTYPAGLFNARPATQMTLSGAGSLLGNIALSTNNTTTVEGYPVAPNNTTQNISVVISAIGKWK